MASVVKPLNSHIFQIVVLDSPDPVGVARPAIQELQIIWILAGIASEKLRNLPA
jgi:hypothetical protein